MLTQERLRQLLDYDPETGLFRWKNPTSVRVKVGDVADTLNSEGYLRVGIDGKRYRAHRLAHLYMTGEFPENDVDHINGIRTDNRWSNLRPATRSQNLMNHPRKSNNTSGVKGVYWYERDGKWEVSITVSYKRYYLGRFDTLAEAAACRQGAAALVFGEYAHDHDKPDTPAANDSNAQPLKATQ